MAASDSEPRLRERPLSPHLQIYRWQAQMASSILHRATGVILAIGALRAFREKGVRVPEDVAVVGWDNTPRRQSGAHTWLGANPYTFRRWLLAAAESVASRPREHRLVFVNAWNEWAEGAVLEPSVEFGHSYLGVLRDLAEG